MNVKTKQEEKKAKTGKVFQLSPKYIENAIKKSNSMLIFEKMVLENAYTFQGVNEIPLDDVGMVQVIGRNLDSKTESSNGSGKTRAWICLLRLLYGRKALKNEKPSDIYDSSVWNFRNEAHFRKGGHHYIVRETKKHKDFEDGLHVLRDGKPWGVKNDPEMLRKEIQAVINRSYEEFIGTVIWRQNNDHVLIDGTPAERAKWISDFFGLSVHDELHAIFSERLEKVKNKIARGADTRAEAKLLQEALANAGDIEEAKSRLAKLREKADKIRSKIEGNESLVEALRETETSIKQLVELQRRMDEVGASVSSLAKINNELETLRKEISKLERGIESSKNAVSVISEYKTKRKKLKRKKEEFEQIRGQVLKDGDPEDEAFLKKRLAEWRSNLAELRGEIRTAETQRELFEKAKASAKILDKMNYTGCTVKYLRDLQKAHEEEISGIEKSIAKLETVLEYETVLDEHTGICPTCGRSVDKASIKSKVAAARVKIEEEKRTLKINKRECAELETAIEHAIIADKYKDMKLIDIDQAKAAVSKLANKAFAAEAAHELSKDITDLAKWLRRNKDEYESALTVSDFDSKKAQADMKALDKKIEALMETKDLITRYSKVGSSLKFVSDSTPDMELTRLKRKREDVLESLNELREKLSQILIKQDRVKTAIKEYDTTASKLESLRSELEELKKIERQERIYKALKKAYGKDGLKVKRLRELLKAIKTRLPVWTNILFTEKNFRIDTTGNEKKVGFEITQTKKVVGKNGKTVEVKKVFDAATASGSERTRISGALMLTMADVASSDKQCNLLVLDELERGLDKQSRQIMAEEVIPLLKNKKPSLFLITHSLAVDESNFDAKLVITKKNQCSKIDFQNRRELVRVGKKKKSKKSKNKNRKEVVK